ncbi:MAG: hypothetical protein ABIG89_04320 [Candidatus Woesearchaeota archaeon]
MIIKKNKKAMAMNKLLQSVLIIGFFVIAILILPSLFNFSMLEAKEKTCMFTVGAKDLTKIGSVSLIREKCPAYNILIYDNKITKDGAELIFKYKDEKDNKKVGKIFKEGIPEDFIYKTIADEMVECWQRFGEGRDLYKGDLFDKKRNCARCTHISFDQSIWGKGPYKGLVNYLKNNKPEDMDKAYYDYLSMDAIEDTYKTDLLIGPYGIDVGADEARELVTYYKPRDFTIHGNPSDENSPDQIIPSSSNNYDILYFTYSSSANTQNMQALGLKGKIDVPAHIFFVKSDRITTYLCENFIN